MPNLRPTALAFCLIVAIAMPPAADAAKKRKPVAATNTAAPSACSDFYSFANADWLKANPVPANNSASTLGELAAHAGQQQRDLLDAAAKSPQNTVQTLLGDFWASGLDEASIERDGEAPIAPLLARIDAIKKGKDIAPAIAALHQVGIPVAFNFTADLDLKNLDTYLGYFAQGGLGLPDASFYTRSDNDARALLGRYNGYVQKVLILAGTPQARAAADAQMVIDLETRLARVSKSQSSLNSVTSQYAPMASKELSKRYRDLQLDAFLKAQGVNAAQVSIADPELFAQIDKLATSLKPEEWRAYLRFQVGNTMAPYLSKRWRDADYEFRGRLLRGETVPTQRWQQVLDAINASAGSMLAHEYVARHLTDTTRDRAKAIAQQVKDALIAAVDANTWMEAQAKSEAKAKLDTLKLEIGKPRIDPDFGIQPMGRGSFGSNILIASTWQHREEMRRIGRSNADRRWDVLPQYPALSYDLAHNRLFVTAAVLQPPVLDMSQGAAAQYGSFGAMVGHELSQAVAGKGRMVDASETLRDWWSPATAAAWDARTAPLITQYAGFTYPGKSALKVDGARTREQNAADLAGLELAMDAMQKAQAQQTSGQQTFFRSWARLWPQQLSAENAATAALFSVHAPGQWRSNGPLMNMPAFSTAFACKAGNAMLRPDAERVTIWR